MTRARAGRRVSVAAALLASMLSLAPPLQATPDPTPPTPRLVRQLEAEQTGVDDPAGLGYSPSTGSLYVTPATNSGSGLVEVVRLRASGQPQGASRVSIPLDDPAIQTFDAAHDRMLFLEGSRSTLWSVGERDAGGLNSTTTTRSSTLRWGLRSPGALTTDPSTGELFVLDQTGPRIVRATPDADGTFPASASGSIDLAARGIDAATALAFDPTTGNLHVFDQARRQLVELTRSGAVVASQDLGELGIGAPSAMTFAPSGDQTDSPSSQSLYLVQEPAPSTNTTDPTSATASASVTEVSFAPLAAAASFDMVSSVVKVTDTSTWSKPSPDPSGLAYVSGANRLVMVDGEVEETVGGITHFQGASYWEMSLGGAVLRTANLSKVAPTVVPMTNEPTGVAWDPTTGRYFFSDDSGLRVWTLNPGTDQLAGTSDDTFSSFRTSTYANNDPEGVAYDPASSRIFVADGVNAEIYQYTTAGVLVGQFDVAQYGVVDPESVEVDAASGTLVVLSNVANPIAVETTLAGALLRTVDLSAHNAKAPAGLAIAPASDGSGANRYYIVDRGIDNDSNPSIIDGRLIEMTAPASLQTGFNTPPTVDAGPDQPVVLPANALLDGTVSDDGRPNPPGSLTTTWSQDSGPGPVIFANANVVDTTAAFGAAGSYVLRLTASDGALTASDVVTLAVTGAGSVSVADVRVATGTDDAEESASGTMTLGSSDLELVYDGSNQAVGLRFNGLPIPQGATIVDASVQFRVDEQNSEATSITIRGQASDNAPTFAGTSRSISSRSTTSASVSWSPAAWTIVGAADIGQRTPNLATIVQEIVARPGWMSGSSLALIFTGTGHRTAEAYEGAGTSGAPLLHVAWAARPANTAPTVSIGAPRDATTSTVGEPIRGTATASDLEDGSLTSGLMWSSNLDGPIGTGGSFSTSTLSVGLHTITATATDADGRTGSASVTVRVFANDPVLLAVGDIAGCTWDGDEKTAALLDSRSGTVLVLGDQAYENGTTTEYADCYDPSWGRHRPRTYPVPGNHEYHTPGATGYFGYFGSRAGDPSTGYYSYDVAGWHIVALNSEIDHTTSSTQIQWLAADLAAHSTACTLAYWHEPRFSSGTQHGSDSGVAPYWQVLYQYGVDVVLNGHEHQYERFAKQNPSGVADPQGIRQFVVGTGGLLYGSFGTPVANSEVRNADSRGVLRLTLSSTGYGWEFVPVEGDTFTDSGSDSCVGTGNVAPVVAAGADQTITLPAGATLDATVTDDALPNPPATVTTTWSKLTGPGTVTFTNANAVDTTATFSTAGTYTLRLTANDSTLTTTDDITITVNPAPAGNVAPVVAAGADQTITLPAGATLDATVTDDALPNPPATVTTTWSKLTGPGTVAFTNANAVDTTATFSTAGTYTLRLTANDSTLTTTDDITITVNPAPASDAIFQDGFESGTLAAWTGLVSAVDLAVGAPGALVGANGLQVRVDDNSPTYVADSSPTAEARYRARFWFDLNSIVMAKDDLHRIFSAVTGSGAEVARVEVRFSQKSQYQIRIGGLNDAGATVSGTFVVVSDAPHAIEIDWQASGAPGASTGSLTLWIDGVLVSTLTGIDNDTHRIESVRLGAAHGIDAGTRGSYSFDAFESRRSTYIGP